MSVQTVYINVIWTKAKVIFGMNVRRVVGMGGLTPRIVAEHLRHEIAQRKVNEGLMVDVGEFEAQLYYEVRFNPSDSEPYLVSENHP